MWVEHHNYERSNNEKLQIAMSRWNVIIRPAGVQSRTDIELSAVSFLFFFSGNSVETFGRWVPLSIAQAPRGSGNPLSAKEAPEPRWGSVEMGNIQETAGDLYIFIPIFVHSFPMIHRRLHWQTRERGAKRSCRESKAARASSRLLIECLQTERFHSLQLFWWQEKYLGYDIFLIRILFRDFVVCWKNMPDMGFYKKYFYFGKSPQF